MNRQLNRVPAGLMSPRSASCVGGALLACCLAATVLRADELDGGFVRPPDSAKPHTWWHWMNGNVSREGITADLEAMKRVGVGGAQIFVVDCGIRAGPVKFMSPEWRQMVKHAAAEADRLGLELCLHNCAGWSSSGGPWITPEYAMQTVVTSEAKADGPGPFAAVLPQPPTKLNFYRDIAVLAFPTPPPVATAPDTRAAGSAIKDLQAKAAYQPKAGILPSEGDNEQAGAAVPRKDIVDLSDRMKPDGRLEWDVPQGAWTILRIGHTPTGSRNKPAPPEGTGLECDKLSRQALQVHWDGMMGPIISDIGPLAGKSVNNALIDSYEVGPQNWTGRFREEFTARRGYDPLLYLPAMTGRIVDGVEITERFLWDLRRTVADLFADHYFGYFSELCHKHGMVSSSEPYGNAGFEGAQAGGRTDIPMGEFWIGAGVGSGTGKLAASIAHTYGRKFVGAESFTAHAGDWSHDPYALKALGDSIYCSGVNRFIFHRYAHQPWLDKLPGMTMGPWGFNFERTNTWWEPGRAWLAYLARCQYLLQSGLFVADVCFFSGESAPNDLPYDAGLKARGHDNDGCDAQALLTRFSVADGRFVLPDGMSYRLLVLPNNRWMTPQMAAKIRDLVAAGGVVIGPKPAKSPSLAGYPDCDRELAKIADELWGPDGEPAKPRPFGKGRIFPPTTKVENALAELNVKPDFAAANQKCQWIHRRIGQAEVYFVSSRSKSFERTDCTFRVSGLVPELWRPDTGAIERVGLWRQEDGQTVVPIEFDPSGSVFVVFRAPAADQDHLVAATLNPAAQARSPRPGLLARAADGGIELEAWENGTAEATTASGRKFTRQIADLPDPLELPGPWTLRFPPGRGAPDQATLDRLASWTEQEDPGVRYFSGTAAYVTTFDVPAALLAADRRVYLDLGGVKNLAEVKLNDRDLGVLWKEPFRVDVTAALRPGANQLEVRVTNLWPNRLIGDAALPAEQRLTFATVNRYKQDSKLLESGLLGPVRLVCTVRINVRSSGLAGEE